MRSKPLIGITPFYDYDNGQTYIKPGYCEGIMKAGGIPVVLPLTVDKAIIDELLNNVSGIILSGGPDVDAKYFNENNMPFNGTISPYRDEMELYISRKAISGGIPILGICRGVQVMNIAMGGTIYQDIHAQIKETALIKHSQQAPKWHATHEVTTAKNSLVCKAYGKDTIGVNSFHHQAINDLGDGFEIVARAPDGIIEAIEIKGHPFALGVQWHPELMWQEDSLHLKLFEAFVASALPSK